MSNLMHVVSVHLDECPDRHFVQRKSVYQTDMLKSVTYGSSGGDGFRLRSLANIGELRQLECLH